MNDFITCPNCGQQISLDDKNLLRHLARKGGLARNKIGKERLSEIGKMGAKKRWGKI
jgi:uncharacterized C2H2 Zn-finger protein